MHNLRLVFAGNDFDGICSGDAIVLRKITTSQKILFDIQNLKIMGFRNISCLKETMSKRIMIS